MRRAKAPAQGLWAIPGGSVCLGETLQQAAEREILEETGLTVQAGEVLLTFETIRRDPTGRVRLSLCDRRSFGRIPGRGSDPGRRRGRGALVFRRPNPPPNRRWSKRPAELMLRLLGGVLKNETQHGGIHMIHVIADIRVYPGRMDDLLAVYRDFRSAGAGRKRGASPTCRPGIWPRILPISTAMPTASRWSSAGPDMAAFRDPPDSPPTCWPTGNGSRTSWPRVTVRVLDAVPTGEAAISLGGK